tara:strand:- start:20196 stop:21386 length:1191 start_codon:yes stop_codon:yes gene_type:complete
MPACLFGLTIGFLHLFRGRRPDEVESAAGLHTETGWLGNVYDKAMGIFPAPVVLAICLVMAIAGMAWSLPRINAKLRARGTVEGMIRKVLMGSALITIMTTFGIVASILFEAIEFFRGSDTRPPVPLWDFLTGTTWAPETAFVQAQGDARAGDSYAEPKFGAVPVFAGTFVITGISLLVAVPIGLFAAIYMAEYSPARLRKWAKPLLEILAGIPTVVYGFFALVTLSPIIVALAEAVGIEGASYQNALSCGLIMGVMIIPLISSLSDDVVTAVPQSLREGSLALGTTNAETIRKVILPAATPGIIAAVLLAISRAIGETMIVVMAASVRANLSINPLEDMTTVTVRIVSALTGDLAFDSAETLSAFALGLVLFVFTLLLNVGATIVIRRFRKKYSM